MARPLFRRRAFIAYTASDNVSARKIGSGHARLVYVRVIGALGAKEPSKVRVRSRIRLDLISLCWVVLHLNT